MKNKLIAISIVVALALGVVGIFTPAGSVVIEKLGSGSSHSTDNMFIVGGVEYHPRSQNFRQATSTLCVFVSPNATSTLAWAVAQFDTATTAAAGDGLVYGIWAKAARDSHATTTALGGTQVWGEAVVGITVNPSDAVVVASTTFNGTGGDDTIFPPSYNLLFRTALEGTDDDLHNLAGSCKAEFVVIK